MDTRVVETVCHDCVVRILWFSGDPDPRGNHIDIQLLTKHRNWWHRSWRTRIRNAWAVLRNRYDWSGLQLVTRTEAVGVSEALKQAISDAWPAEQ
ncbi:MAG: hypothetical protein WD770_02115 [Actinomycetota bacterium]